MTEIAHARLLDRDCLFSLRLESGRIASITPEGGGAPASPEALDAAGGLVVPSLVDAHLHLDLAHTLDLPISILPPNRSGTLLEAIAIWSRAKAHLLPGDVERSATRAIREIVGSGGGFIRSHVDVGSSAGLRLCQGVLAARQQTSAACRVQLVAFPQDGILRDPDALPQMREALRMGVEIVGGIPHIERTTSDGLRHLATVFDLAGEFDAAIDVHIDETDDPSSRYTEHLAAMTIERGWQGRVTASHVCALAGYDEAHAARVMDLLAEARVSVVTNPGVNLHLQGRFDRYPMRRGLTRVRDLLSRGVDCAAGQDCIRDVFYPLGSGAPLDQALLLAHAEHMASPGQLRQAFDLVCGMAARVVGSGERGVRVGGSADLAVFACETVEELVRLRPAPLLVYFEGRCAAGSAVTRR